MYDNFTFLYLLANLTPEDSIKAETATEILRDIKKKIK